MKKSSILKALIQSDQLEFIMEAHNGLSARIVEEAGFKGIWASGLSISAALGVRDNNEASWTQVLEVVEFMSDAARIPILLDGDTGYGNFNNMRRLVRKLEQRDVAGVCIEDKVFPKTNSFLRDQKEALADINEFAGKIKAAKDSQTDDDFVVVARLEALIAGWGLGEALKRAEAYRCAGADAILVHSKKSSAIEIEAFMKEWGNRHPVVIVPTKYYSTPTDRFRELGVSLVIWANHNVRSAIVAMQKTTERIFADQSLVNVEDSLATVAEIFRLQGDAELEEAEERYLPNAQKNANAIVLAAAQGDRLGELTKESPKTQLKINGKSILAHLVDNFHAVGVQDITVVRGFGKDKIQMSGIRTVDNDDWNETKELWSLYLAREQIRANTIISFGDIFFKRYVLNELLNDEGDFAIIADPDYSVGNDYFDLVQSDAPYQKNLWYRAPRLVKMSPTLSPSNTHGEFIGIFKVNAHGAAVLRHTLESLAERDNFRDMRMSDLFSEILMSGNGTATTVVNVVYVRGSWTDVDTVLSLQKAIELSSC